MSMWVDKNSYIHIATLSLSSMAKIADIPEDDKDYKKIAKETEEECIKMYVDAVEQEKTWADYLFKDGSMIGLNATLLNQYVELWLTEE